MELLVSATLAVAARRGTIEPSVREILEQAGLSTKAFYRHFRSKDELLLVTLEEGSRVLVEYLEHRMSTVPDPLDKVGAWINGVVRQAVNPSAARRTLPWTLGASRLATVFPEQFDKNQARIIAPFIARSPTRSRTIRASPPIPPATPGSSTGTPWTPFATASSRTPFPAHVPSGTSSNLPTGP